MKIYEVGGAVRDGLMGLPVTDRDYVVVGATPEEMTRLGYQPVGRDFPVFLHPRTKEEYALARTERKVARGYKGFSIYAAPEVTLEQDLARRDLTINAIARDEDGRIVDPFGGAADIERGLLRHVGPAFAEDPVRILRVARFAARFDFEVAPETLALMRSMVASGEADALVPERVWQEFSRGLMERDPARMLLVLAEAQLLLRLLPELPLEFEHGRPANDAARTLARALGCAVERGLALAPRFALLAWFARGDAEAIAERLRAPNDCRELALLAQRQGEAVRNSPGAGAEQLLRLLERCDAFRRPERFMELLSVCECRSFGESSRAQAPYPPRALLARALAAAAGVDAGAIAAKAPRDEIAAALGRARIAAIEAAL